MKPIGNFTHTTTNTDTDCMYDQNSSLTSFTHTSVLLSETIQCILDNPKGIDGTYIDGTFGRGGHSALLLQKLSSKGRLIALDRDKQAVECGYAWKDSRFTIIHSAFSQLNTVLNTLDISFETIDGILLDLGVSSPQIDEAKRGFSFNKEAPLDMRMDTTCGITAADVVNSFNEADLTDLFKTFGEEPQAKRIAAEIVCFRQIHPINSTVSLANLIERTIKFKKKGIHPATLVFQALRIYVNQELKELECVLTQAKDYLCTQGKLAIISFHSLEDRTVKQAFRPKPINSQLRHFPRQEYLHPWKEVQRIKPNNEELKANPRCRSAILRVAIRQR